MPRVTILEPNKAPQPYRFPIDCQQISIGSKADNDIIISCPSVSGSHCLIQRAEGGYIIQDNDSTNGIRQGEIRISVGDLFDESVILVGDTPITFQLSEEEINTISQEKFVSHLTYFSKKKEAPSSQLPPIEPQGQDPVEELGISQLKEAQEVNPSTPTLPQSLPQQTKTAPRARRPQSNVSQQAAILNQPAAFSPGLAFMLALFGAAIGICLRYYKDNGAFLLTDFIVKATQ